MESASVSRISSSSNSSSSDEENDRFEVLTDFTLTKLLGFKKGMMNYKREIDGKLREIERKQENIIEKQMEREKEIKKSTNQIPSLDTSPPAPACTSTPVANKRPSPNPSELAKVKKLRASYCPPTDIEDLSIDWQEKLKPIITELSLLKSDKMTPAQAAFLIYWIQNKKQVTATNATAMELVRDGCKAGVWIKSWSPSGVNTLQEYLLNRLKNEVRKKRRSRESDKLQKRFKSYEERIEDFADLLEYVDD